MHLSTLIRKNVLMEFCPTCGCFLAPQKLMVGEETVVVLTCGKCGYKKQASDKATSLRSGRVIHRTSKPAVTVISEEDQRIQTMPTIKVQCPKCENNLVYVWQVQTRGGDEASTQFMRCTKCGHTFREYSWLERQQLRHKIFHKKNSLYHITSLIKQRKSFFLS